ncbi:MAG: hypothetical protein K8S97_10700 [Anaerolineae bacterium]|nr:hypothetical protein [Anaerolineae bacterium]
MERKWIVTILLILPMIGLAILPLYEQAKVWNTPDPQWTISSNVAGASGCYDLPLIRDYNVQRADDLRGTVEVSSVEGRQTADHMIADHHGWVFLQTGIYGSAVSLVRITPPDGTTRLAWTRVLVWDDGGSSLLGKADIAYVDASTGDPLLLITDVTVGDPGMVCTMILADIDDMRPALLSLIALAGYAALLLLGSIVFLIVRRMQGRRAEGDIN